MEAELECQKTLAQTSHSICNQKKKPLHQKRSHASNPKCNPLHRINLKPLNAPQQSEQHTLINSLFFFFFSFSPAKLPENRLFWPFYQKQRNAGINANGGKSNGERKKLNRGNEDREREGKMEEW